MLTKEKRFYSVNEVCEVLSISRATFYRIINEKELRTIKIGCRKVVRQDDLKKYIGGDIEKIGSN